MKRILPFAALCIGFAFDFLFWKKPLGISWAIFLIFSILIGFSLLRAKKISPAGKNFFLFISIIFFSVMSFLRKEPLTTFLNIGLSIFSTIVLVMTYSSGLWSTFNLRDYGANLFQLVASMVVHPQDQSISAGFQPSSPKSTQKRKTCLSVFRGILLALPILFIFAVLLSSADLVFAQKLDSFFANFQLENIGEYLFRGSYILLIAYFFVGLIRHVMLRSQQDKKASLGDPLVKRFLGFTETSIVLGSVIALFSVFVVIQFQYLFFGQSNISLSGFTYSEYARRGFGELVAVAVFSLLLLQGLSAITKRETKQQKKIFSGLITGLVITVLVILVSAFQRLLLYESAYGFSQLRTYAHVFMLWLGILLAAVVIFEILERLRFVTNLALTVLIGFTATLNCMNVDAFIAHQNVKRAVQGEGLDVAYLASLTDDAIPGLVRIYSSTETSSAIRDEVGVALVCHIALKEMDNSQIKPWQSFHLSTWRADQAVAKIQKNLAGYHIREESWQLFVTTPNGLEYSCREPALFD